MEVSFGSVIKLFLYPGLLKREGKEIIFNPVIFSKGMDGNDCPCCYFRSPEKLKTFVEHLKEITGAEEVVIIYKGKRFLVEIEGDINVIEGEEENLNAWRRIDPRRPRQEPCAVLPIIKGVGPTWRHINNNL